MSYRSLPSTLLGGLVNLFCKRGSREDMGFRCESLQGVAAVAVAFREEPAWEKGQSVPAMSFNMRLFRSGVCVCLA